MDAPRTKKGLPLWPLFAFAALCAIGTASYVVSLWLPSRDETTVTARPTNTLLLAVRDLSRLETTQLHMEKVIDLTEQQRRFFGLLEGTDALLLVAVGDVTVGVDLGKLRDDDVAMDPNTKIATMRLPAPEIFSVRLDERGTYVHRRTTSLLAERDEQLESKARQRAVAAIEKAAREAGVTERAKQQAERQLCALATALGASEVQFVWREGEGGPSL